MTNQARDSVLTSVLYSIFYVIGYENRIPHNLSLPPVYDQSKDPFLSFTNNLCIGPILLSFYLMLTFLSLSLSLLLSCFDLITTWIAAATLFIHNKLLNITYLARNLT